MGSAKRHKGHNDSDWIEQQGNKERLLNEKLAPLSIDGTVVEIDTAAGFDYVDLLKRIRSRLK